MGRSKITLELVSSHLREGYFRCLDMSIEPHLAPWLKKYYCCNHIPHMVKTIQFSVKFIFNIKEIQRG